MDKSSGLGQALWRWRKNIIRLSEDGLSWFFGRADFGGGGGFLFILVMRGIFWKRLKLLTTGCAKSLQARALRRLSTFSHSIV